MQHKPLQLHMAGSDGSIILKFNEISVVFPEQRHIFPKMYRICLEVIIDTFKPVKFIALYC